MNSLDTARDVVKALGGTKGLSALLGGAAANRISNWRSRGKFPAWFKDRMMGELAKRGYTAPPSLWGQR